MKKGPLLLLGVLALAACARPGPEALFDTYLERLERTLDVARPPVDRPQLPRQPDRAGLRLVFESTKLDTLDFLSLSGCEVQITIGKRNSSLGRMASASQRLLLDLEYLRLAPECINWQRQKGNDELALVLREAYLQKQAQLPRRIFLATLGGPEYRALWQRPHDLTGYPANTGPAVVTALEAITTESERWLAGDYRADNLNLELLLSEVNKGDGGALLLALATQSSWLGVADRMLNARQARGPLCLPPLRPAVADILPNVVARFFAGEIQPWSAAVNRRQYQLLPPVLALESLLQSALPPAYTQWQAQRDALLDQWRLAPKRHVHAVQELLAPCTA
ncbi:DUF3080 family protein [Parahaliea maris]|nr:DUF3080 family protein [Parahaliea maris]